MTRSQTFIALLSKAQAYSREDPVFADMALKLKAKNFTSSWGPVQVKLTAPKSHNTSRMMEDAVRFAFDDARKSRSPDALFNGEIPVEVKHRPDGFRDVPSDSYAVKDTTGKWYILISGQVTPNEQSAYNAYIIRSDHYRNALDTFKKSSKKFDEADIPSINPDSPWAISEIESAINAITKDLALAILRKSSKREIESERGRPRMSLNQRVGVNRVRFDVKFESLIRGCVREIMRS